MKYDNYKFHCSDLPHLMTNGRKKDELLSETAKSKLLELWIKSEFERSKYITSEAMRKGTMVETDSLELLEKVSGKKYFKNNQQFENDYLIGTPDVVEPLIDIKSSWDLWTFAKINFFEASDTYFWQLAGYGILLDKWTGSLVYALVNTPEPMIENELFRLSYNMPEKEAEKYRNNYIFDDIPAEKRIKNYELRFVESDREAVITRIKAAREYMNNLTL